MESEEQPSSSKSKPKNLSGGHGKYCCIPGCNSAWGNSERKSTGISLFQVPSKEPDRAKWINVLKKYRRKGANDSFDPQNKKTFVCEFHFKDGDIRKTFGSSGRKVVRPGCVPSVFAFKSTDPKRKKRKSPTKRTSQIIESSSESIVESDSDDEQPEINQEEPPISELDLLKQETMELKLQLQKREETILKLDNQNKFLQSKMYTYENISKNEEIFRKTAGLELQSFQSLIKYVSPGEKFSNIKYYDTSRGLSDSIVPENHLKAGPATKLDANNQLFLYLTWLKNGLTLEHVSLVFQISKSTVSRYIITWTNFLYFSLGAIPIWPTRSQVNAHMPKSFKELYPTTRCIIDCTELFCQRPSSLATQSSLYSHYKSRVTYKGLIGISPSGATTFISQLYDGSISDKQIVRQSGFLHLWDKNDSVMADNISF